MTITPVGALNQPTAQSSTTSGLSASTSGSITSALNIDFTTYLKILTTQLQNQDPTDATDPNQFTQELIQIEQVNVQNSTNADLQSLTNATSTNGLATGVSYIGNYAQANSSNSEFALENGGAEFGYSLPSAAATAIVNIEDSNGNVVAQLNGGTAAGGNYVAWNGQDATGKQLPDGTYTFTVAAADASGHSITSTNPVALFLVKSVQSNTDGSLQLIAGSLSLSTTDVTDLYSAATLPTTTYATPYTSTASTG